jgi:hypothetical protein
MSQAPVKQHDLQSVKVLAKKPQQDKDGKKQAAATRRFIAIRQCDSLHAPAVFLSWEDCGFYLDLEENEGNVDFQAFDVMLDAMEYILCENNNNNDNKVTKKASPKRPARQQRQPAAASSKTKIAASSSSAAAAPQKATSAGTHYSTGNQTNQRIAGNNTTSTNANRTSQFVAIAPNPVWFPPPPVVVPHGGTCITAASSRMNNTTPRKRSAQEAALTNSTTAQPQRVLIPTAAPIPIPIAPARSYIPIAPFPSPDGMIHPSLAGLMAPPPPKQPAKKKQRVVNTTSRLREEKRDKYFEEQFELLQQYKNKYGSCDVPQIAKSSPPEFKSLGSWVNRTRVAMNLYQDNKDKPAAEAAASSKSKLDDTKVKRLLEIGFVMTPASKKPHTASDRGDLTWDEMFEILKEYKAKHGNMDVPDLPKSALRYWIVRVRESYTKLKEGKPTQMTAQRIAKLTEIGFNLKTRPRLLFDERALSWFEYFTKHGHDPRRDDSDAGGLGKWVTSIRFKYKLRSEGKKTSLSQERVDKVSIFYLFVRF